MTRNALRFDLALDTQTPLRQHKGQVIALAAVSAGCAAAAVATGSYALWLSRCKAADGTLTSVNDLLETCRKRVARMEQDLARLPGVS